MTGEDLVAKKEPVSYSAPENVHIFSLRLAQQKRTSDQGTGGSFALDLIFELAFKWACESPTTSSSAVGFMVGLKLAVMVKLKIGSYSAPRVRLCR